MFWPVVLLLPVWMLRRHQRGREEKITFFTGKIKVYQPRSGSVKEYRWDRTKGFSETQSLFALRCVLEDGFNNMVPEDNAKPRLSRFRRFINTRREYKPFLVPKRVFTPEQEEAFRRLVAVQVSEAEEPLLRLDLGLNEDDFREAERVLHPILHGLSGKVFNMVARLFCLSLAFAFLFLPVYGHVIFNNPRNIGFPASWQELLSASPLFALLLVIAAALCFLGATINLNSKRDYAVKSWVFHDMYLTISDTRGTRKYRWFDIASLRELPQLFLLGGLESYLLISRRQLTSEQDKVLREFLQERLVTSSRQGV